MGGPRFQPFDDLPAAQYQRLRADIEARGIVNPILVDEDGKVIDGHQRRRNLTPNNQRACRECRYGNAKPRSDRGRRIGRSAA